MLFLSISFCFSLFLCIFLFVAHANGLLFSAMSLSPTYHLCMSFASRKQVAFVQSVDWWHLITLASLFLVILMLLLLLFWLLLQHYNVPHHVLPCFLVACWCLHDLFMHRKLFIVGHTNSLTDSLWRVMQTTLFRGRKRHCLNRENDACMKTLWPFWWIKNR